MAYIVTECEACDGTGIDIITNKRCEYCGGTGLEKEPEET